MGSHDWNGNYECFPHQLGNRVWSTKCSLTFWTKTDLSQAAHSRFAADDNSDSHIEVLVCLSIGISVGSLLRESKHSCSVPPNLYTKELPPSRLLCYCICLILYNRCFLCECTCFSICQPAEWRVLIFDRPSNAGIIHREHGHSRFHKAATTCQHRTLRQRRSTSLRTSWSLFYLSDHSPSLTCTEGSAVSFFKLLYRSALIFQSFRGAHRYLLNGNSSSDSIYCPTNCFVHLYYDEGYYV